MTSLNLTPSQIEFLQVFFKKRPAKVHFIQLPDSIRISLGLLLDQRSIEEISSTLDIKIEIIKQLFLEKSQIDKIHEIINSQNISKENNISYVDIRHRVKGLLNLISLVKLSKILKIPRTTLSSWRVEEKKKIYKKGKDFNLGTGTTPRVGSDLRLDSDKERSEIIKTAEETPSSEDIVKIKKIKVKGLIPEDNNKSQRSIVTQKNIEDSHELIDLHKMIKRHIGKVNRKYSKSEKDLILKLVDKFGSKLVHIHTKVSYDTISRLLRQRERGHIVPSTKAKYMPVIETMRKYPGMGPMQIRDYIHRHIGKSMGVNSVRKAMEDNGWIPSYSRTILVDETDEERRYEAVRKNYLWHLDFKHFYINKCKVYLLFIEDDFSRFIVGHALSDAERVDVVIDSLNECIQRHGKPEMLMSDGGSAFYAWRGISKLTRFLEDFGIDQKISRIPRINGKVESINQKIEKELLNTQSFSSLKHLEEELAAWVGFYNFKRSHQGLDKLQVPADRFHAGAEKWFRDNDKGIDKNIFESMALLFRELQNK